MSTESLAGPELTMNTQETDFTWQASMEGDPVVVFVDPALVTP